MTRKRKQNTAVLPEVERGSVDNPYGSLDELHRAEEVSEESIVREKCEDYDIPFDDQSTTKTRFGRIFDWFEETKMSWQIALHTFIMALSIIACLFVIYISVVFLYVYPTTPDTTVESAVSSSMFVFPEQFTIESSDKASLCSFVQADGGIPLSIFRGNEDSTTGKPVLYTIYCK